MIYMADDREVSYPRRLYHDVTGTSLPEWEIAGGRAAPGGRAGTAVEQRLAVEREIAGGGRAAPGGGAVTAAGQRLAVEWVVAWRQSGR